MGALRRTDENVMTLEEARGFSLSAFRKANKVHILIGGNSKQYKEIFTAYYCGKFNLDSSLEIGSYGIETANFLNDMMGNPILRSITGSFSSKLLGEHMSGAFAASYTPYIKSTSPVSFQLPCYLPLFTDDLTKDGNYEENIEIPINTLFKVYLPQISTVSEAAKEAAGDWLSKASDFVFSSVQGAGWDALQASEKDLAKNFFGEVKQLVQPLQFQYDLKLYIGNNIQMENIMIKGVNVSFAPLLYSDENGKTIPAYAVVTLNCLSKHPAIWDNLKFSDKVNSELEAFIN